jgi:hypothetical protein
MSRRGFLVTCLVLLGAGALLPPSAAADEKRFAVASLYNQSGDVTVNLNYRWVDEHDWRPIKSFGPGHTHVFARHLDQHGNAPELDIVINEAIGAAPTVDRTFRLRWHPAADDKLPFGHKNAVQRDTTDRDYVTVVDIGPPDVR